MRKSAALLLPLRSHSYLAGETFTAADISCGWSLGLGRFLGFEDRLDPALRQYLGRLSQRPAFERAMARRQAPSDRANARSDN